jgi:hypothetical protein
VCADGPQEADLLPRPRPQQASLLWTLVRSGRMWLLRRAFESSSLVMSARHSSRLKCVCELCSFIQAHSCRPLVRLSFSITCVYRHKIRKRKAALFPLRLACGGVFALSCCCPAAARSCRRLVSSSNYKPRQPSCATAPTARPAPGQQPNCGCYWHFATSPCPYFVVVSS